MDKPKLSIIIVSWNVKNFLSKCLYSLYEYRKNLNIEVIVVDNNSTDGSVEIIRNKFPDSKIIANKKNLGFAKANNQGIAVSNADLILLLNPDTEIMEGTLQKMVEFMQKNEKAGIAGCKHLNPDFTFQPSVRRFPNFLIILMLITKIAKIFPNNRLFLSYLAKDIDNSKNQQVDQVAGSFFLIKKKLIDQIENFDEKFFIWFEEVDMCKRAKNAGWQVWYVAQAQMIHHGGQSFKQQLLIRNQKNFLKSALYYLKKHGLLRIKI